mgnify:CR=1 FL=1
MKKVTLPAFVILLVALAAGLGFVVSRTTDLPTVEEFTKDLQKANSALESSDQVSRDVMPYQPQYTDDGGTTWSVPRLTDFPNTCSRA